jgi:hypothetical protein
MASLPGVIFDAAFGSRFFQDRTDIAALPARFGKAAARLFARGA